MKIRIFRKTVPALMVAFMLGGCIGEEIPHTPDNPAATGSPMTITVSVPGQRTPTASRSIDGAPEAAVQSIHVLVFKSGATVNDPEVLAEHVAGDIVSQSTVKTDDYKVQFKAKLKAEPDATTVMILANVPAATITAATAFTNKQDVLAALTYASSNAPGTSDGWKWNVDSPHDPIPMYGEYDVTKGGTHTDGLTAGMKMDGIDLVRMLARIDVESIADGFTLSGVYVVNFNTKGYVAPAWNSKGVLTGSLPAIPMIPTGANPLSGESTVTDAMYYPYSGSALAGEIYVYEAAATSGEEGDPSHTNAMCLIIKGMRTGDTDDTYYRIDFTGSNDGLTPDKVQYMPVYRNHRYSFVIEEINGAGHADFDAALTSLGILNNLKANMLVLDESGIRHTVFDGKNYLGVGAETISVASAGETGVALQVSTNYAGGWRAVVENAAANTWLTLTTTSGLKTDKTLMFNAAELTGDAWAARSATILMTAGLLETQVTVNQGDFRIIAEPAHDYILDGITLNSFKVKSNTQWAVRSVSDIHEILLNSATLISEMLTRTGGPNTSTGDDFTFTLVNDSNGSLSGKTFTVTFFDPSGLADDLPVIIAAIACGCNGTALALKIGTNGYDNPGVSEKTYLTHMYGGKCWMVQNSKEGTHSGYGYGGIGSINSGNGSVQVLGANGFYYDATQARITSNGPCPDGWHLPVYEDVTGLMAEVNANINAPKAMWWVGAQGINNGAFAGFHGNTNVWGQWGTFGYWWYGTSLSQNFYGTSTSNLRIHSDNTCWFSVRCVHN